MEGLSFDRFPDCDLVSVNQGVFVLEHDGEEARGPVGTDADGFIPIPSWEDPADDEAPRKRMKLFHDSWDACRQRVESVVRRADDGAVEDLVDLVLESESRAASQLALYTRRVAIPSAALFGASQGFVATALARLNAPAQPMISGALTNGNGHPPKAVAIRISGRDCASIPAATRRIVSAFVNLGPEDEADTTPKSALEDFQTLPAWYGRRFGDGYDGPKLVVLVDDFEMAVGSIMEDLILVLCRYALDMPLFLILSVQSSPDAILSMLPRTILPYLRLAPFWLQPTDELVTEVLHTAFIERPPPFDVSARVVLHILEGFSDSDRSLDAVVSKLQYLHFAFFYRSPTTWLVTSEMPSGDVAARAALELRSTKSWRDLVEDLSNGEAPLGAFGFSSGGESVEEIVRSALTDDSVIVKLAAGQYARRERRAAKTRQALSLLDSLASAWVEKRKPVRWVLAGLWNGDLLQYAIELGRLVEKSDDEKFVSVLAQICERDVEASDDDEEVWQELRHHEAEARELVASGQRGAGRTHLVNDNVPHVGAALTRDDKLFSRLVSRVSELIRNVFESAFGPARRLVFEEAWTWNDVKALEAVFDPRYVHQLKNGMQRPAAYLSSQSAADSDEHAFDTSTVYGLYRESGKLVNLSDWSGAFDVNCRPELDASESDSSDDEDGGEDGRKGVNGKRKATPPPAANGSPRKRARTSRGRREGGGPEGGKASKRKQVDARFLRAVGDLGYQGFVTATKRRPEHVNRIVW